MIDPYELDQFDEGNRPTFHRGNFLVMGVAAVAALFGVFYFTSTYNYMQQATDEGGKAKRRRVPLAGLRFDHGIAGPVDYATNQGIYLTRHGSAWLALEQTCPHQGCPVAWTGADQHFVCPCHGSQFDRFGAVVQGPAGRPLYRHLVQVEADALIIEGRA